MPTVNVYLNEQEYVRLANLAMDQKTKATLLARKAIQRFLEDQKQKETK